MGRYFSFIILLFTITFFGAIPAHAQYGNEWIDYTKTYWKFKVGTEGIFRINKTALDVAGVPSTANGNDYVLYRDGKEITLFVSNNAAFGAGDYIEFYAKGNDGQLDKELYLAADKVTNENKSLFNDTASYFLSVDNSRPHARYTNSTTAIPGAVPAPSAYCRATITVNGTNFLKGKTNVAPESSTGSIRELYSSQFDQGEGYVISGYSSELPGNVTINTPNLVATGSPVSLQTACIGISLNTPHKLKVYFNSNLKADVSYGISDIKRFDFAIPATELTASNTLTFTHTAIGVSDGFYIPFWKIEYPRDWNFNGLNFYSFKVQASGSAQYIEVNNFNYGGDAPRLYDLSNNKYYTGEISVIGKTRFYIDASLTDAEMVLYSSTSSKILSPSFAKQENFTNYNTAANQGDYIIITHKNLMKSDGGKDNIQEYKNYRSSAAGGSHTVVVADIEELYDQYAYGIFTHPSSITHFANFALDKWSIKPKDVFIIGKGVVYTQFKSFAVSSFASSFEGIVPTYGHPGSDAAFVTDRATWKMKLNIGRLSAWNTTEVANYLNKIKAYEAALLPASFPTPASEIWKKQVLHIAGGDGNDKDLQTITLLPTLMTAENIIEGSKTGGIVTTIAKNTKGLPTSVENNRVDSLVSTGLAMITYYGHGAAASLDYNIKDPSEFTSLPKIPVFSAFGCEISTIFEVTHVKTITEAYIAAPVSGSIVSMASNNPGYTNIHSKYIPILYAKIAVDNYGETIGNQYRAAYDSCIISGGEIPYQTSMNQTHMESFILQGDPGTRVAFENQKPDYYVGNDGLTTLPINITTESDSFQLKITAFNLGKTIADTVQVKIEHTNPGGKITDTKTYIINGLANINTSSIWMTIDKTKDLGLNKYKVTIDNDNRYEEQSEANNVGTIDVFILSDNIVPIYPYNFGIVYNADLTLKASTLNPFKGTKKYRLEVDTTEFFNSPLKMQTTIDSKGGVIKWKPGIILKDSVVYYWRTSIDSTINGSYIWANSSFIYLQNGSEGWNQSHYFQYKYNALKGIQYPESRKFNYEKSSVLLRDFSTIMELDAPYEKYRYGEENRVFYNGEELQRYDCYYGGTLQIIIMDSTSGKPWENPPAGQQGSFARCAFKRNVNCFSFPLTTAASRNNAKKFLDSIPNGNFVFVRNCIANNVWGNYFVDTWKADTLIYGSGNSLYHAVRNLGFNTIDSFYQTRVFSMLCKKGFSDYPVQQHFAAGINDILDITYTIPVSDVQGKMNSIIVGPASSWKTLKWRTATFVDTASLADSSSVKITGITASGSETFIYEGPVRDTSLDFISAAAYPRLKLEWYSKDSIFHTTPQLDYWRVLYDPLPEAALNPAAFYTFTDTVSVGQLMKLETAIETLTERPMDSMLLRYKVIDANGVGHLLEDRKYRKLAGNDTLHASISFDPKPYPGNNYLFIEANPDNNQPEQYHPNNLGYIPFSIKTDKYNPVMDVTFDGMHILDRDIISAKPFIKVLLRDENKFIALKDTTTMKLFMRYPGETDHSVRHRIAYDGNVCKFVPAEMSAGKNEAYIEYRPNFATDGIYQLYAKGTDASGNDAGDDNEYSISFEVINKSSITNLLNYPNPFSTSTAFVFTLTGWQLPSQFKIQILSVTGKVVREITRQELGNIHIGRNVTDYKWDGKDQYGQTLGNGVYLYRVVTAINGENIERRTNNDIDKFYKNGYSKMYIMR